jgi:hypothetical protein
VRRPRTTGLRKQFESAEGRVLLRVVRNYREILPVCYCTKYEGTAQRAVDRESQRVAPRFAIDALQSIGTAGHGHINFRGTYRFPIDRYAARLLPPAA